MKRTSILIIATYPFILLGAIFGFAEIGFATGRRTVGRKITNWIKEGA